MPKNELVKPKLRRSIYIGLGGTGTDAIKVVKDYFIATTGKVPSMIKFLAIDTNQPELSRKGFEPEEQLAFVLNRPQRIYNDNPKQYDWIPDKNIENIQGIGNTGAGQVRSNGAFVLYVKENIAQSASFTSTLSQIRNSLINVTAVDPDYDLLATTKIDIHMCFSLCGGTGSGMFIEMAKLIKDLIPNSNVIGYAVSNSFYDNVGIHWNVKSNAYAALLELDYCMHAHKKEYQNSIYEKVNTKPFDALMYIDNQTYTRDGTEEEYSYEREEVLANIGYAMVLSAGSLGDDANSIIDNLKGAILNGGYDVDCRNGKKSAWVSSLGVSEIFCRKNSSLDLFAHNLAIRELGLLKDGNTIIGTAATATQWINDLNINEGGPNDPDDHDALINRMINPDLYHEITVANSIKVDNAGNVDESMFRLNSPVKFSTLESHYKSVAESLVISLDTHVKDLLFPSQGQSTCGLSYLQMVLTTLKESIERFKARLEVEIGLRNTEISNLKESETKNVLNLNNVVSSTIVLHRQQQIAALQNSIRLGRLRLFKLECAIKRRQMAIDVYTVLINKIVNDYLNEIARFRNVLEEIINSLNSEVGQFEIPEKTEERSTSVDVSFVIAQLPDSQIGDYKINNWRDFFVGTQHSTIKDLADKQDWKEYVIEYVKKLYPNHTSQTIVKILKKFKEDGTLNNYVRDVLNRARPLMEISTFGKPLNPTEFVIVSLPDASDEQTKFIRDAIDSEYKGPNAIQYISIKDSNRIIVYRQLGVIPPYFINGISSGKNGEINSFSCEDAYKQLRNNDNNYSPFTRLSFEQAVVKGGHSLDSFLGAISDNDCLEMWVTGFILGLIDRKEGVYRIESEEGEIDQDEEDDAAYIYLGRTRQEAYDYFCSEKLSDKVKKEFSSIQTSQLQKPQIREMYDSFFNFEDTASAKEIRKKYRSISLSTPEERIEDKAMFDLEFKFLKSRK